MNLAQEIRTAVDRLRARIEEIDSRREVLEAKRAGLMQRLPHTDDVVAFLALNIDRHRENFVRRVALWMNEDSFERSPTAMDGPNGFALFGLPKVAGNRSGGFSHQSDHSLVHDDVDAQALVALLAPVLKGSLRTFVMEVWPSVEHGTRAAERRGLLREIDDELGRLNDERETLVRERDALKNVG